MNQEKYTDSIIARLKQLIVRDLESDDKENALKDSLNLCEVYDDFYTRTKERDKKLLSIMSELNEGFSESDEEDPKDYDFLKKSSWLYNEELDDNFSEKVRGVVSDEAPCDDDTPEPEPAESNDEPAATLDSNEEEIINPISPENYEFNPEEEVDYEIPENDQVFETLSENKSDDSKEDLDDKLLDEVEQMESEPSSLFAEKITVDDEPARISRKSLFRRGLSASERMSLYSGNGEIFSRKEAPTSFDDESDNHREDIFDEVMPEADLTHEEEDLPSLDSFIEPAKRPQTESSDIEDVEQPSDFDDDIELGNLSSVDLFDDDDYEPIDDIDELDDNVVEEPEDEDEKAYFDSLVNGTYDDISDEDKPEDF